jgi:hypothetical protein
VIPSTVVAITGILLIITVLGVKLAGKIGGFCITGSAALCAGW